MFDFTNDQFQNGMNNRNGSWDSVTYHSQGNNAVLHVFSPTSIPTQVIRPYVYNFTDQLVEDCIRAKNSNTASSGSFLDAAKPRRGQTQAVNTAILPDVNGIKLDLSTPSQQWSFILYIDVAPISSNRRALMPTPNRLIATGYCYDDPINPATGTINPNAVLVFTKSSLTYVQSSLSNQGAVSTITGGRDCDYVSELNAQVAADNVPLYLGTPQDLAENLSTDFGSTLGIYGNMYTGNMKNYDSSKSVSALLKNPKSQLQNVLNCVDSGVNVVRSMDNGVRNTVMADRCEDPLSVAYETFNNGLFGSSDNLTRMSIDTSKPITMSSLISYYPNLVVEPYKVNPVSPWDTAPQDVVTKRNQASALISNVLTYITKDVGLSDIAFRYASYTPNQFAFTNQGIWEMQMWHTLIPMTQIQERSTIELFQRAVEQQLVPILKTVYGDFDLLAYVDTMGDVLVDVGFMDDYANGLAGGFYQTTNRLGGLINPMLGTESHINSNASQLHSLKTNLISAGLNPEGYIPDPIIKPDIDDMLAASMPQFIPQNNNIITPF